MKKDENNTTRRHLLNDLADSGYFSTVGNTRTKRLKFCSIRIGLKDNKEIFDENTKFSSEIKDLDACLKYVFKPLTFYKVLSVLGSFITEQIPVDRLKDVNGSKKERIKFFSDYCYTFDFQKPAREYLISDCLNDDNVRAKADASTLYWKLLNNEKRHGSIWLSDSLDNVWHPLVKEELRKINGLGFYFLDGRHYITRAENERDVTCFIRTLFYIQNGSSNREVCVMDFDNYDQIFEGTPTRYTQKLVELACGNSSTTLIIAYDSIRKNYIQAILGNFDVKISDEIVTGVKKGTLHNYTTVIIDGAHHFGYREFSVVIAGIIGKLKKLYVLGLSKSSGYKQGEAFRDFVNISQFMSKKPIQVGKCMTTWKYIKIYGDAQYGIPLFKLIGYTTKETATVVLETKGFVNAVVVCSQKNYKYWKSACISMDPTHMIDVITFKQSRKLGKTFNKIILDIENANFLQISKAVDLAKLGAEKSILVVGKKSDHEQMFRKNILYHSPVLARLQNALIDPEGFKNSIKVK